LRDRPSSGAGSSRWTRSMSRSRSQAVVMPAAAKGDFDSTGDADAPDDLREGGAGGMSGIDTEHSRTVGLCIEDMSSPYAPTLRPLHKQRAVLESELQKVMTAIEGLEALDRTTKRRIALAGSSLVFQGLELQARTARAAAETVLRRVGTPLAAGELRKLI